MNAYLRIVCLAAMLIVVFLGVQAQAQEKTDPRVSFQTFYDQLGKEGTWLQDKNYGYVWRPTENDPNWQPYTYGYWINTSVGLTWVSNEPFGWATYHYGRWMDLHGFGWVWVPGYTWSPAWVSWRYGDDGYRGDYCGWAPLPPDSEVGIDYFNDKADQGYWGWDFHIGHDCDRTYGIGPGCYHFCPVADMGDHDCWRHFYNRSDNSSLMTHTRNVTDITFHRDSSGRFGRVESDGSLAAAINVNARIPLERVQLTSASQPSEAGLHGDTLAVYAPRIDPGTLRTSRPAAAGRITADTSVNQGTDINASLAVNSGTPATTPSAGEIHATPAHLDKESAHGRETLSSTSSSPWLAEPLTSLRINRGPVAALGTGPGENRTLGNNVSAEAAFTHDSRYLAEPPMWHAPVPARTVSEPGLSPATAASVSTTPASLRGEGSNHYLYHPGASLFHSTAPNYLSPAGAHALAPEARAGVSGESYHGGSPAAQISTGSSHGEGGGHFAGGHAFGGHSGSSGAAASSGAGATR